MPLKQDKQGRYYSGDLERQKYVFTVYCKSEDGCDLLEEIDVLTAVPSDARAIAIAEQAIEQDYENIVPVQAIQQTGTFYL